MAFAIRNKVNSKYSNKHGWTSDIPMLWSKLDGVWRHYRSKKKMHDLNEKRLAKIMLGSNPTSNYSYNWIKSVVDSYIYADIGNIEAVEIDFVTMAFKSRIDLTELININAKKKKKDELVEARRRGKRELRKRKNATDQ
jgi:hypothetical protein